MVPKNAKLPKREKTSAFITGAVPKPTQQKDADDNKYSEKLEDWDSKHHQILTWIRSTCISSIELQFAWFETAKEVGTY